MPLQLEEARRYATVEPVGPMWVVSIHADGPSGLGFVRYKGEDEERARQIHANAIVFIAQFLQILRSEGRLP